MTYFRKTVVAGPLVKEAIYPAPNPRDSREVRRHKRELSRAALQRVNDKHAWQRLEGLLACNFAVGDPLCVLTYDADHLPQTRQEALANMAKFNRDMSALRRKRKLPYKYIYITEHKHEHRDYGEDNWLTDGRWHHHIIMNSAGSDLTDIQKLWPYGKVLFKIFRVDRNKNYESLARYFCKEQRDKVGQRFWSCSRNLAKPEVDRTTIRDTEENITIEIPEDADVYSDTGNVVTVYGKTRAVKYIYKSIIPHASGVRRMAP